MKKRNLLQTFLCLIISITCLLTLTSCVHKHKYSKEWSSNDTHHWHQAICEHSDLTDKLIEHEWDNGTIIEKATHLKSGKKEYKCLVCGKEKIEEVAKINEHTFNNVVDAKYLAQEATCISKAKYYKSCECGVVSTEVFEHGELGSHNYGDVVYVWSNDNKTCTATRVCGKDESHAETETVNTTVAVKQNQDCTHEELVDITATFVNPNFSVQEKKNVKTKDALGHDYENVTYVWSNDNKTCTATRVCKHDVNHAETETVNSVTTVKQNQDCTHEELVDIKATFVNPNFSVQEKKNVKTKDALGHDYENVTYVWSNDNKTCTATRVCKHDVNHAETETVNSVTTVKQNQDCTHEELVDIKATFVNPNFSVQEKKNVKTKDALGHDYENVTYVWSNDNKTCTATCVCGRDENHIETETVNATVTITQNQTCENSEKVTYKATFVNPNFSVQEKKNVKTKDALGHSFGNATYNWNIDYSKCTATRVCIHDENHVETETVNTTKVVKQNQDCTHEELVDVSATFVNPNFSVQEKKNVKTKDALGHDYENVTYVWSNDNKTCTATCVCGRDENHVETETVNATVTITQNQTCENSEKVTYKATFVNPNFSVQEKKNVVTKDALGHDYGSATYNWNIDHSMCTATRVCEHDENHVETETVNTSSEVTQDQTCEDEELTTYTAEFENEAFATQVKSNIKTKDALGHSYNGATYDWSEDYSECTATRVCKHDENHVETETVSSTSEVTQDQTCEDDELTTYTAEFENEAFATQVKSNIKTKDALGHSYNGATYDWSEDYSECTATRVCKHDANHVETETVSSTSEVTQDQTCEDEELTTYTAEFDNEAFATQVKSNIKTKDALGHSFKNATYDWSEDYSECTATRVCKHDANHVETETVNTSSEVTQDQTCEDEELTTYTAEFENEAFATQVKSNIKTKDALGHSFKNATYNWSEDYSECTATRVCKHDASHVETETVNTSSEVTQDQTCEDEELTTYTAEFENEAFATQVKSNIKTKDALGHSFKNATYNWSEDYSECTATRVCKHDENHVETETVSSSSEVTQDQTCEDEELTTYTAEFENEAFATQVKSNIKTKDALGHSFKNAIYNWSEDYSECTATRVCKHDENHVETETVSSTSEVTQDQTCEDEELTTYTAQFENEAFATQVKSNIKTKDALGHSFKNATYNWSEDYSECTATRVCKHDENHVETETVNTSSEVTQDQTCEDEELTTYTAEFENEAFATQVKSNIKTKDALGHSYNGATYDWSEDYSECTATRVCKHDENHVETETVSSTSEVTQDQTCEDDELTTYTAEFENEAFATQVKSDIITKDALGHSFKNATYNWSEDYSECTATRVCKHDENHVETETASSVVQVLQALSCLDNEIINASCEFTNVNFTDQTLTNHVSRTAHGHNYGSVTYDWSEDYSECTATRVCKHNENHVETETVSAVVQVLQALSCLDNEIINASCEFTNVNFTDQTLTNHVSRTAHGHNYGSVTYDWSEDYSECTATRVCKHDENHVETETVSSTSEVTQDQTCEDDELTTYTAEFENEAFATQVKSDIITKDALGHNYGSVTYNWSEDYSECTASRVCEHDENHVETETVSAVVQVLQELSCLDNEIINASCEFTNVNFIAQTLTNHVSRTAHGHNYGSVTYNWSEDYSECTATRVCKHDENHVETETASAVVQVLQALSCLDNEIINASCEFTNVNFTDQTLTNHVSRTAHGHNYGSVTYDWSEDYSECTATRVCKHDENHVETETVSSTSEVTQDQTCEDDELTTYTAQFENEAFVTQIKSDIITKDAFGHNYGSVTYNWSEDYSECTASRVCEHDENHVETETVSAVVQVLQELSCLDNEIINASCEFTNVNFIAQTLTNHVSRTAHGHNYGSVTYDWSEDYSECTATRVCKHDENHVETETVSSTSEVTQDQTCEDDELTTYTAQFENEAFVTQIKSDIITKDAFGHNYGSVTYNWSEDYSECTASRVCEHDENHIETETVSAIVQVLQELSCLDNEIINASCEFTNVNFIAQTLNNYVSRTALGHDFETSNIDNVFYHFCKREGCTHKEEHQFDANNECTVCGYHLVYTEGLEFTVSDYGYLLVTIGTATGDEIVVPPVYNDTEVHYVDLKDCSAKMIRLPETISRIYNEGFSNCTNLEMVNIPNSVTKIGQTAFYNCSKLTEITIPDSVTAIEGFTFMNCTALTTVHLNNNITELKQKAFINSGISSITLPSSLVRINENCFEGCKNLEEINIPEDVEIICDYAFKNCTSLKTVTLPTTYRDYQGTGVFYGCSSLTSVTMKPCGLTVIPREYFRGCTSLESFIIPNGITEIGYNSFYGVPLRSVSLPNTVTKVGIGSFFKCSSLASIILPTSITIIDTNAFDIKNPDAKIFYLGDEEAYSSITINSNGVSNTVYFYSEEKPIEGDKYWRYVEGVPTVWTKCEVDGHNYDSGYTDNGLTHTCICSVCGFEETGEHEYNQMIQNESTKICDVNCESGALYYYSCVCGKVSTSEEDIFEIGSALGHDFDNNYDEHYHYCNNNGCTHFEEHIYDQEIESPLTKICDVNCETGALYYRTCSCGKVSSNGEDIFEVGSCLGHNLEGELIKDETNHYCKNEDCLKGIPHEYGEDKICDVCGYEALFTINLKYTLLDNDTYAVGMGTATDTIIIIPSRWNGKDVTAVYNYGFKNKTNITQVILPNTITTLKVEAFSGCTSLTTININNITSCESRVFYNCSSITNVIIPSGLTIIGEYMYYNCSSLSNVVLSEGITSIGTSAFEGTSVSSINLPSTLTKIEARAFYGLQITSIVIPEGVTSIRNSAFESCAFLQSANLPSTLDFETISAVGNNIFKLCISLTNVTIAEGLTMIPSYCFNRCTSLVSITLPSGVTKIGYQSFFGCTNLETVIVPSTLEVIGQHAFADCKNLNSIVLPVGFTKIEGEAGNLNNVPAEFNYFYLGSEPIYIEEEGLANRIYYYSNEEPLTDGLYWHYVDSVPTIWE